MSKKTAKKPEARKCIICKKAFTPKTANAIVCSDKCRKTHKANLKTMARLSKNEGKKHAVKAKASNKVELPKVKSAVVKAKKPTDRIVIVNNGDIVKFNLPPVKCLLLAHRMVANALEDIGRMALKK